MKKAILSILLLGQFCLSFEIFGLPNYSVEEYIAAHKMMAVEEMQSYRIPASITMAQAIIESGFGNSYLAREAQNHFGIKCHAGWTGPSITYDDDVAGECFRKYNDVAESFRDHSEFLNSRDRYKNLFSLSVTDYVGWAYGLKDAGYATDPNYPLQLIETIEKYNLYELDRRYMAIKDTDHPIQASYQNEKKRGFWGIFRKRDVPQAESQVYNQPYEEELSSREKQKEKKYKYDYKIYSALEEEEESAGRKSRLKAGEIVYFNRIKTTTVSREATPAEVARAYEMDIKKICKYNDVRPTDVFPANSRVYLQPKRIIGVFDNKITKVQEDQSMWEISQKYGVKLSKLYKKNHLKKGEEPEQGQIVYLRTKNPRRPVVRIEEEDYLSSVEARNQKANQSTKKSTSPDSNQKNVAKSANNYTADTDAEKVNNKANKEIERTKSANSNNSNAKNNVEYVYTNDADYDWTPKNDNSNNHSSSTSTQKPKSGIDWITADKPEDHNVTASTDYVIPSKANKAEQGKLVEKGKLDNPLLEVRNNQAVPKKTSSNNQNPVANTDRDITPDWLTNKPSINDNSIVNTERAIVYEVQPKETLYSLSKRFNTTVEQLKLINGLSSNDLKIGQKILIVPQK